MLCTAFRIRHTTVDEVAACGASLIAAHRAEVGGSGAPDLDAYRACEAGGRLILLGAWCGEQLLGYSASLLQNSANRSETQCRNVAIYADRDWRQRGVGSEMISATTLAAAKAGASAMIWPAPVGGKLDRVLDGMADYTVAERVYVRSLV